MPMMTKKEDIARLKENDLFRYSIHESHVVIESVKVDYPVVEFPKMLEGLPVTELAGYVLSGKNCEEVYIPEGIWKIGRYGFYNCRNLRKISFSSDFVDIGSGAFTGCHHIKEIEVLMKEEKTCLKEVLVEVPEAVCVRLLWKKEDHVQNHVQDIEGIFWFPEYFEESIENTPARILSVKTHGSGMFYRNCFRGKVFQIQEYDNSFKNACVFESNQFLMELVYGRLSKPVGLSDKSKEIYEHFVREHRDEMVKYWVEEKNEEAMGWVLLNFPHKREEQAAYQELMEFVSKKGTTSMVSSLMEYGRKIFPPKRKSFDL